MPSNMDIVTYYVHYMPKLVKLVHDVTLPIFYCHKKANDPAHFLIKV
jgi:hypothetical protein